MLGPFVVGALKHSRGDYTEACLFLAFVIAFGAAVAYVVLPIVSDDATMRPAKNEIELSAVVQAVGVLDNPSAFITRTI